MRPCTLLPQFLDRQLSSAKSNAFERHLDTCEECRTTLASWQAVRAELAQLDPAGNQSHPRPQIAAAIVARARETRPALPLMVRFRWIAVAAGIALIVAGGLGGFVLGQQYRPRSAPPGDVVPVSVQLVRENHIELLDIADFVGSTLDVPEDARLLARLGSDRVALKGNSRARVEQVSRRQVRLELNRGEIACSVARRKDGSEFVVKADQYRVHVIGTRFSVAVGSKKALDVRVFEGTVEVWGPNQQKWLVHARQALQLPGTDDIEPGRKVKTVDATSRPELFEGTLADELERGFATVLQPPSLSTVPEPGLPIEDAPADAGALPLPEPLTLQGEQRESGTVVKQPDNEQNRRDEEPSESNDELTRWRAWIIDGRYQRAETEMVNYLQQHPQDWPAWSLLADCRRKGQKWQLSLDTYQRVIREGPRPLAKRARFMSAVVLQEHLGRHDGAIQLLKVYLELTPNESPLRAAAMVRLARSYMAIGRPGQAKPLLRHVMINHKGTAIGKQARQLLIQAVKPH